MKAYAWKGGRVQIEFSNASALSSEGGKMASGWYSKKKTKWEEWRINRDGFFLKSLRGVLSLGCGSLQEMISKGKGQVSNRGIRETERVCGEKEKVAAGISIISSWKKTQKKPRGENVDIRKKGKNTVTSLA